MIWQILVAAVSIESLLRMLWLRILWNVHILNDHDAVVVKIPRFKSLLEFVDELYETELELQNKGAVACDIDSATLGASVAVLLRRRR